MSGRKIKILVTGAGSLLGQGLLRSLSLSNMEKEIFTADPSAKSAGHWLGDKAQIIPMANHPDYLPSIKKIIKEHDIDVVLVGTDVELPLLAEHKQSILEQYDCKVIVSPPKVIKIANDKFLTATFLEEHGFPFPASVLANNKDELKVFSSKHAFPLFAKPRDGARSKGIKKILNERELLDLPNSPNNLVVQQYLANDEQEYTSGCLVVNGKCKSVVTMRRDLRDGNTYRAYRDEESSKYDKTLIKIAEALGAEGPVNFQFRIQNDEPVVFEINGRYSGTTPIRAMYGFNEVEALLMHHFFDEPVVQAPLRKGTLLRTWSDVMIDNEQVSALQNNGSLSEPACVFGNYLLGSK